MIVNPRQRDQVFLGPLWGATNPRNAALAEYIIRTAAATSADNQSSMKPPPTTGGRNAGGSVWDYYGGGPGPTRGPVPGPEDNGVGIPPPQGGVVPQGDPSMARGLGGSSLAGADNRNAPPPIGGGPPPPPPPGNAPPLRGTWSGGAPGQGQFDPTFPPREGVGAGNKGASGVWYGGGGGGPARMPSQYSLSTPYGRPPRSGLEMLVAMQESGNPIGGEYNPMYTWEWAEGELEKDWQVMLDAYNNNQMDWGDALMMWALLNGYEDEWFNGGFTIPPPPPFGEYDEGAFDYSGWIEGGTMPKPPESSIPLGQEGTPEQIAADAAAWEKYMQDMATWEASRGRWGAGNPPGAPPWWTTKPLPGEGPNDSPYADWGRSMRSIGGFRPAGPNPYGQATRPWNPPWRR